MASKTLKIAMAGPSGVGKTTLCQWASEHYGIPFITTSTKPLWEKHGIKSHQELIYKGMVNPQWGLDFQNEVLDYRPRVFANNPTFITDRSPIDNLVYFLMQNTPYLGEEATLSYATDCMRLLNHIDLIIQIPFNHETVLVNDGARIVNKYYQLSVNSQYAVAGNILAELLPGKANVIVQTLSIWDFEQRKALLKSYIEQFI